MKYSERLKRVCQPPEPSLHYPLNYGQIVLYLQNFKKYNRPGRREKIPPKLTEDLGKIGHEIEPTVVYSALSPKNKKILKIF
jgi:hypothetical protein